MRRPRFKLTPVAAAAQQLCVTLRLPSIRRRIAERIQQLQAKG